MKAVLFRPDTKTVSLALSSCLTFMSKPPSTAPMGPRPIFSSSSFFVSLLEIPRLLLFHWRCQPLPEPFTFGPQNPGPKGVPGLKFCQRRPTPTRNKDEGASTSCQLNAPKSGRIGQPERPGQRLQRCSFIGGDFYGAVKSQ